MSDEELRRYIVAFRSTNTGVDKRTRCRVLTWNGERKAIALAALAHAERAPRTGILEVDVDPGPEPQIDEEGVVIVEKADLIDRMEW